MSRHPARRALAGALGLTALLGVGLVPAPAPTEAAWTDAENATTGNPISALNVPEPVPLGDPACRANGNLLGLTPTVTIDWAYPAGTTGYSKDNAEIGMFNNAGLLEPVLTNLLGYVETTDIPGGYRTTAGKGLLSALLGGSTSVAIRIVHPGPATPRPSPDTRWKSDWLVADAKFGALGIGNSCTTRFVESYR